MSVGFLSSAVYKCSRASQANCPYFHWSNHVIIAARRASNHKTTRWSKLTRATGQCGQSDVIKTEMSTSSLEYWTFQLHLMTLHSGGIGNIWVECPGFFFFLVYSLWTVLRQLFSPGRVEHITCLDDDWWCHSLLMTCVNVRSSTSISVMELIMTRVLPELSAAPAVNDDPAALVGGGGDPAPCRKRFPVTHLGPPGSRL